MTKEIGRKQAVGVVAAIALSVAMLTVPVAAQGPDSNGESAVVVAHLAMPGPAANQMLLQRQGGQWLLYFDQGVKEGVAVVDVTTPNHPRVVEHAAWPGRTAEGQIQTAGNGLAISERPEGATVGQRPAAQRVNILDITDPQHPQVLQKFSGVTSVLADAEGNLIFIANGEGLWVVRHRTRQGAYARRHPCTSEAADMPEPDCY